MEPLPASRLRPARHIPLLPRTRPIRIPERIFILIFPLVIPGCSISWGLPVCIIRRCKGIVALGVVSVTPLVRCVRLVGEVGNRGVVACVAGVVRRIVVRWVSAHPNLSRGGAGCVGRACWIEELPPVAEGEGGKKDS